MNADDTAVNADDTIVRCEHVGMKYGSGKEILKDVSFTLGKGSFHFLTGQSGAGKTSLLRLLYLAHLPSRGKLFLFGRDVARLTRRERPKMRQEVGVVFQDFRLIDHFTAEENVALPLRIKGVKESRVREHVRELLKWVELERHIGSLPSTLSVGEQQRIALARAVITSPRLLLADEPTGSVDRENTLRLLHLMEGLNRIGTTVLVATHSRDLMERFPYSRYRIADGRIFGPGGIR